MTQGDYNRAVADLSHAIELKPDRGISYFARGISLAELGKDKEAAEDQNIDPRRRIISRFFMTGVSFGPFG